MPVDVELTTESFRYTPTRAGTTTIIANRFHLPLNTGVGRGGDLSCEARKGDFAIDTLEVVAVATPTAADVHQVVRTDVAEDDKSAASPLAVGILVALTVGAIGLGLALHQRRTAPRRK